MSRKKKAKKALPPRAKRMARSARLSSARNSWLKKFNGRNIVSGYRKHFGVDWACAFKELEMLGVKLDAGYKTRILKSVQGDLAARRRRKVQREEARKYEIYDLDQDDEFFYIAGYTSWGFAYGVTWEEWEQVKDQYEKPDQIQQWEELDQDPWEELNEEDLGDVNHYPGATPEAEPEDIPF